MKIFTNIYLLSGRIQVVPLPHFRSAISSWQTKAAILPSPRFSFSSVSDSADKKASSNQHEFYRFSGNLAAPLTPYTEEDTVDTSKVAPYAELLVREKLTGVFLNGTSAESVSLTKDERIRITQAWLETEQV